MSNDVVIAGGGPTGLMLACELGLAGVRATVIERLPRPSPRAPGVAVSPGCVAMLDLRGLMDPLREETMAFPGAHFSLIWLDLGSIGEPHPDAYLVPQQRLEQSLEARARQVGVDIRRGHELVDLTQDDDGVTSLVRGPRGVYPLRSGFVVGCDGPRSGVRSLVDIEFNGTRAHECHGIVAEVELELAELAPEHLGAYVSASGGSYTGTPTGPGLLRVMTIEYDDRRIDDDEPVVEEEFHASVQRLSGKALNGTVRWLSRFGETVRQARRYRAGRVFLAGDAAHEFFPLNGLGLSTGLQDAVNLGWKLAAHLHGWAPPGLLDTYHDERYPIGEQAARDVSCQASLLHPLPGMAPLRDMVADLVRFDDVNRYLARRVMGLAVRYPFAGAAHPLLGAQLPPVALRTPTGPSSTSAIMTGGRGVLLDLSGGRCTAAALAARWNDRVDSVSAERTSDLDASAFLLRPDGHVAWAGACGDEAACDDGEAVATALGTWFGDPLPARPGPMNEVIR